MSNQIQNPNAKPSKGDVSQRYFLFLALLGILILGFDISLSFGF
jgi:hypothetical protein